MSFFIFWIIMVTIYSSAHAKVFTEVHIHLTHVCPDLCNSLTIFLSVFSWYLSVTIFSLFVPSLCLLHLHCSHWLTLSFAFISLFPTQLPTSLIVSLLEISRKNYFFEEQMNLLVLLILPGHVCACRIDHQCPRGWWGSPTCGPCHCDTNKGFDPNCNKTSGHCHCKVTRKHRHTLQLSGICG